MTPTKTIQRCGTPLGYSDHHKNGTTAGKDCPDGKNCLTAYAKYMRDYRHRTGRSTRTLIPDETAQRYGLTKA